ncbi:hypothetical protein YDYSY3_38110 [Paenibacillus chitinolyticus]|nr:hypothetical protein YDYSY3_38110 [Paenibacillus chitinolyticus]
MQLILWSSELRKTVRQMKANARLIPQPTIKSDQFVHENISSTARKKPSEPKEYWV